MTQWKEQVIDWSQAPSRQLGEQLGEGVHVVKITRAEETVSDRSGNRYLRVSFRDRNGRTASKCLHLWHPEERVRRIGFSQLTRLGRAVEVEQPQPRDLVGKFLRIEIIARTDGIPEEVRFDPGYSGSREKALASGALVEMDEIGRRCGFKWSLAITRAVAAVEVDHPRLVMALGDKMRSLLDTGALNRDRFMFSFDGRLFGLVASEYKGDPVLTIRLLAHSLHDI